MSDYRSTHLLLLQRRETALDMSCLGLGELGLRGLGREQGSETQSGQAIAEISNRRRQMRGDITT